MGENSVPHPRSHRDDPASAAAVDVPGGGAWAGLGLGVVQWRLLLLLLLLLCCCCCCVVVSSVCSNCFGSGGGGGGGVFS